MYVDLIYFRDTYSLQHKLKYHQTATWWSYFAVLQKAVRKIFNIKIDFCVFVSFFFLRNLIQVMITCSIFVNSWFGKYEVFNIQSSVCNI